MSLFQISNGRLNPVQKTSFIEEKILERKDLQQILKADISPLGDDLMVISEEFGDWEDSNRRIDLLCLDKQANLVVVELKRTSDGGHMELQAIRYAAMVSSMTLEQAIDAYARYTGGDDAQSKSSKEILDFLGEDSIEEVEWGGDVRIVLVSHDFSSELTTAVIWLNKHDIDITCVRLIPYKLNDQLLIDVTQIIPLPEASDYEVKIRAKEREIQKVKTARQEIFRKFWFQTIDRSKTKTQLLVNRSTSSDHWLSAGIGRSGFGLNMSLTESRSRVECYIRIGKDKDDQSLAAFKALEVQKDAIEKSFGGSLVWDELPDRSGCRIHYDMPGGWKTHESEWPALQDAIIDALIRLESSLRKPIHQLKA